MPSDDRPDDRSERVVFDAGLLSPVTVGFDDRVTDAAFLDALVTAEVALTRAWAGVGVGQRDISESFGWTGAGEPCSGHGLDGRAIARGAVSAGNPVIPLIGAMKARLDEASRAAVHRGATSQDILDSAMMLTSRRAGAQAVDQLRRTEAALAAFAVARRDQVAAGRTLAQHAVPTTVGLRAANWLHGVRRARARLETVLAELPAQLGGAAGTQAAFEQIAAGALGAGGSDAAASLPAAFAAELGLAAPEAPWHTTRWPVTELGDALVQVTDALGVMAADVATLSRTEIGELAEGVGGGSSAMPQKQNPTASVLIRSAAIRAPHLGATLHSAAALAVDERPDGAWHAEWPTLRELLRLILGASGNAVRLTEGLRVDDAAVARNLALTGGLIVSERLVIELAPVIGRDRIAAVLAGAMQGGDLRALLVAEFDRLTDAERPDVDQLLDPAQYTGRAAALVDDAVEETT